MAILALPYAARLRRRLMRERWAAKHCSIHRRYIGQDSLQLLDRVEEVLVHLRLLVSHQIRCNDHLEIPILSHAAKADEQIGIVRVLLSNPKEFHGELVLLILVLLSQ